MKFAIDTDMLRTDCDITARCHVSTNSRLPVKKSNEEHHRHHAALSSRIQAPT